ncbi:hypothetical protein [Actinacidiphila rubida]|uniref:Uncharacterized protein n=1 Tax=Actinacidiphila rubida TaxID=310780 RepID=A0A1H8SXE3_9ACTN|nr:hypothetical protein [Actinacidiphila rubida]SEO83287.1 hypothetical protein SAMN05216267_104636 [Actinacidiphila rubida]
MPKHTLAIRKYDTYGHEVILDGTNIANGIDGLTITMRAGQPSKVEVSMPIVDVTELQDPEPRILVTDATRAALLALGWTAPAEPGEKPTPTSFPDVKGHCPACGGTSLFLGEGGYPTCSRAECPEPDAASTLLERDARRQDADQAAAAAAGKEV